MESPCARGKSGTSCWIFLCRKCAVRGVLAGFMPCRCITPQDFSTPARFWAACERTLLRWRVFVERASALCFAGVFSGSVRAHFAFPAQFGAAGAFPRIRWRDFVERACARGKSSTSCCFFMPEVRLFVKRRAVCRAAVLRRRIFSTPARFCGVCERTLLCWRDFGQRAGALRFAGVFSGKVRAHFASMARFWAARAFPRLRWRDFVERASALRFAGVFSGKVRAHFASMAQFGAAGAFPQLRWRVFVECASALCFAGVFSGKVRAHFALLACFRGACGRTRKVRHQLLDFLCRKCAFL